MSHPEPANARAWDLDFAMRYIRDCSWHSITRSDLLELLEYLSSEAAVVTPPAGANATHPETVAMERGDEGSE